LANAFIPQIPFQKKYFSKNNSKNSSWGKKISWEKKILWENFHGKIFIVEIFIVGKIFIMGKSLLWKNSIVGKLPFWEISFSEQLPFLDITSQPLATLPIPEPPLPQVPEFHLSLLLCNSGPTTQPVSHQLPYLCGPLPNSDTPDLTKIL